MTKKQTREYQFADKTQQLIRANRFLAIAVMVLITLGITWIAFFKNKKGTKMRYITLVGQCLISWIISFAYSQDFAILIGGFVLIGGILYFDKKYSLISGIAYFGTMCFSVGAAEAEQERQKEIMDDVLLVADEVRKGTENAMDMFQPL